MSKKRIAVLLTAAMFSLTMALPATASSGTLHCGSGGNPKTSKQGDPNERTHYVQGYGSVVTTDTYRIWPFTVGSRAWSVTPGTGSGVCIA